VIGAQAKQADASCANGSAAGQMGKWLGMIRWSGRKNLVL